jgi:multiple sugar transport system permease protein
LAVIVLPMVIPGITQALIWGSMLGAKEFGTLNRIVGFFGIDPILWLRTAPMLSIVLVNFWRLCHDPLPGWVGKHLKRVNRIGHD